MMSLILCLPFLRLNTSAATLMPSFMPVPTRASGPDSGTLHADDEFLGQRDPGRHHQADAREAAPADPRFACLHELCPLRNYHSCCVAATGGRISAIARNRCLSIFPVAEAGNAGSMTISAGRL